LNNLNKVTPGTDAYKGFSQAAKFWETVIANDVTVKLDVGFSALGPGILGSTGSITNVAYVGDIRTALQPARRATSTASPSATCRTPARPGSSAARPSMR
jgi:hypothetical protein